MAFTITAELPLGTFRGAGSDGQPERLPSVARLYSALLCAAGFGPRARPVDDRTDVSEQDAVALRWLEENPPDGVSVPALQVNRGGAVAYRDDGTLKKSGSSLSTQKLAKAPDASVAVAGPFSWSWETEPPHPVADALAALCQDVPYLGTTESPVRLRATTESDSEPSHHLDPEANLFSAMPGLDIELPLSGRLEELHAAHQATGASPPVRRDAWRTSETSGSPVPGRGSVALARYVERRAARVDVPWADVLLLPLANAVPVDERVRFAVAAHRALISAAAGRAREDGGEAPPLITGVYPAGRRPANGLAIHVVDQGMPIDLPGKAPGALALLVPREAIAADVAVLTSAAASLTSVKTRRGSNRVTAPAVWLAGSAFWREPVEGTVRTWWTAVPSVPDTRGVRGGSWTFREAALLSLAFAWRELLEPVGARGDARARQLVDQVIDRGALVVDAVPVRSSDVQRYVHKVHPDAVVRPYRAHLWLDGETFGDRTVTAIGQARHLGGGLLVPVDTPESSPSLGKAKA